MSECNIPPDGVILTLMFLKRIALRLLFRNQDHPKDRQSVACGIGARAVDPISSTESFWRSTLSANKPMDYSADKLLLQLLKEPLKDGMSPARQLLQR